MTGQVRSTDSAPTAILDRVSLVLDAFDGPGLLTLTQVVNQTGLPRSSAHRILERLVQMRWLRRDGRNYELGIRLMELGSLAIHQDRLHHAALPFLHELHRVTGHVVHLGILHDSDVIYLEKIGGRVASALPSRAGGRFPADKSPIGKALLACSATAPAASSPALSDELDKIRQTGMAFATGENVAGIGGIAVPIGPIGGAIAAISICGPLEHLKFDHHHAAPVRMAAIAIMRNMSGTQSIVPTLQRRSQLRSLPTAARMPQVRYA